MPDSMQLERGLVHCITAQIHVDALTEIHGNGTVAAIRRLRLGHFRNNRENFRRSGNPEIETG